MKQVKYIFIALFLLFFQLVKAQQIVETKKVIIGVKEAPPFVDKKAGEYTGISIDSWNLVNEKLHWEVEYKEYETLPDLLQAIEHNEVDFSINPITVTEERAKKFEFTQPFFISNTVIAKEKSSAVWNVVKNLWSKGFLSAVAVLVGVIFIFGFLIWLAERKKNKEQFGVGKWKGLGQGFWWSAVTMTTVGYGDKSPVTTVGRLIGIVWMFFAIIIISSLTAGIASSLTVQNLSKDINSVNELSKYKIKTVKGSSTEDFLKKSDVPYTVSNTVEEGLESIENEEIDLFIYDEPMLKYSIQSKGMASKISVLPKSFRQDYYAYSFPKNSYLLNEINPLLISVLKTNRWKQVEEKYHED